MHNAHVIAVKEVNIARCNLCSERALPLFVSYLAKGTHCLSTGTKNSDKNGDYTVER